MEKLVFFPLILFLTSSEIVMIKADFFLDDVFGENSNQFNRVNRHGYGHSLFDRDSDPYEHDSQVSFGWGLNPASFNGNNGFEADARIQHFPGAQIHRDKNVKRKIERRINEWDAKRGRYKTINEEEVELSKKVPGERSHKVEKVEKVERVKKVDKLEKDDKDEKDLAESKSKVEWDEPRTYRPSRSFDVTRRFDPYNRYEREEGQYKKIPDKE